MQLVVRFPCKPVPKTPSDLTARREGSGAATRWGRRIGGVAAEMAFLAVVRQASPGSWSFQGRVQERAKGESQCRRLDKDEVDWVAQVWPMAASQAVHRALRSAFGCRLLSAVGTRAATETPCRDWIIDCLRVRVRGASGADAMRCDAKVRAAGPVARGYTASGLI